MKRLLHILYSLTIATTATVLFFLVPLAAGCSSSTGTNAPTAGSSLIRPSRVESVVALGAYGAVIAQPDKRASFEQALASLDVLVEQERWDLSAAVTAIASPGVLSLGSEEGSLLLLGAPMFADAFLPGTLDLRQSEYARAVIVGARRGLGLALRPPGGVKSFGVGHRDRLAAEAAATRP